MILARITQNILSAKIIGGRITVRIKDQLLTYKVTQRPPWFDEIAITEAFSVYISAMGWSDSATVQEDFALGVLTKILDESVSVSESFGMTWTTSLQVDESLTAVDSAQVGEKPRGVNYDLVNNFAMG